MDQQSGKEKEYFISNEIQSLIDSIANNSFISNVQDMTTTILPFVQKRSINQSMEDLCGFHALFNGLTYIQELNGIMKSNRLSYTSFWKFYYQTRRFLQANFPNKQEVLNLDNFGELHRFHMEFLLDNQDYLQTMIGDITPDTKFCSFHYAFGMFQNSQKELDSLQQIFTSFQQSDEIQNIVLFAGITVHWITLAISKFGDQIYISFIDSNNLSLYDILEGNLEKLIQQLQEQDMIYYNEPIKPEEIDIFYAFFVDLKVVLKLISQFTIEGQLISHVMVEHQIEEMILSFYTYGKSNNPKQILYWMQYEQRPEMIRSQVYQNIQQNNYHCKNQKLIASLQQWELVITDAMKILENENLEQEQVEILVKMKLLLQDLKSLEFF